MIHGAQKKDLVDLKQWSLLDRMAFDMAHRCTKTGVAACLEQENEDLVVLEQYCIIHNHGQRPGHFVVQPEGQKLGYIALAAAVTASGRGDADGRVLMHQLHCTTMMHMRKSVVSGMAPRGGGGRRGGGGWGAREGRQRGRETNLQS